MVAPHTSFQLLDARRLPRPMAKTLRLSVAANNSTKDYLAQLEAVDDRVTFVIFSGFALRIATVIYQRGQLSVDRLPIADLPIDPRELFADVQLIYWPADAIRAQVQGCLLMDDKAAAQRTLRCGAQPVVQIQHTSNTGVVFEQLSKQYTLRVVAQTE